MIAKIKDIETKAPGLNAWYVYTAQDGSLKIDGDMEENILAAFKLVTIQDDVVDLYNKINVDYKNAIASDAALNDFMEQLPEQMKNSVEDALTQLGEQNAGEGDAEADAPNTDASQENVEQNTNQAVNQIVRATSTVNVRSSDSEEADRIGKVDLGTELTRVEERITVGARLSLKVRKHISRVIILKLLQQIQSSQRIRQMKQRRQQILRQVQLLWRQPM